MGVAYVAIRDPSPWGRTSMWIVGHFFNAFHVDGCKETELGSLLLHSIIIEGAVIGAWSYS